MKIFQIIKNVLINKFNEKYQNVVLSHKEIILFGIVSRVILISFAILVGIFPNHIPFGVETLFYEDDSWASLIFDPFIKWDSIHFVKIALYGYTKEYQYAFFPLYPMTMRFFNSFDCNSLERDDNATLPSSIIFWFIIRCLLFNLLCGLISSIILKQILLKLEFKVKYINLSILCHLFNPASIFFVTLYSESLFNLLTYLGFYLTINHPNSIVSIIFYSLACYTRSIGIFNSIFLIFFYLQQRFDSNFILTCLNCSNQFIVLLSITIPYLSINKYIFDSKHFLKHDESISSFPNYFPFSLLFEYISPYSEIQQRYWNVGLFRYYHLKQLPNFIIALPSLMLSKYIINFDFNCLASGPADLRTIVIRSWKVHLFFLTLMVMLQAHVQILTRIIFSSNPLPSLFLAYTLLLPVESFLFRFSVIFMISFLVFGFILHCNYFPWT